MRPLRQRPTVPVPTPPSDRLGVREASVVLAVALVVRAVVLLLVAPHLPLCGDTIEYLGIAQGLTATEEFTTPLQAVRPPLYSLFISLGLDADGNPWPGVHLLQIAVDLGTCVLAMRIAARLAGRRAGLVAGWIYALLPSAIFYAAGIVMCESTAGFVAALALWSLVRLVEALRTRAHSSWSAILGAVCGIGCLTREWLLPVIFASGLALLLERELPWRRRWQASLQAVGVCVLVLLPWSIHTYRKHGVPLPAGSYVHLALVWDNAPGGREGRFLWGRELGTPARTTAAWSSFADKAVREPGDLAHRAVDRVRLLGGPVVYAAVATAMGYDGHVPSVETPTSFITEGWRLPPGTKGRFVQLAGGLSLLVFLALSAAGIARRWGAVAARASLLLVIAVVVIAALTVSMDRYRMVLLPFLAPFAGIGLCALLGEKGASPRVLVRAWGWSVAVGIVLGTAMFLLPVPDL